MRILRFIVNGQIVTQDPNCDFSNLVPGSEGCVQAEFVFSNEWRRYSKVAAFYSLMGSEYSPQALDSYNRCTIPTEALCRRHFKIRVIGKMGASKMITDKVTVSQTGGKV